MYADEMQRRKLKTKAIKHPPVRRQPKFKVDADSGELIEEEEAAPAGDEEAPVEVQAADAEQPEPYELSQAGYSGGLQPEDGGLVPEDEERHTSHGEMIRQQDPEHQWIQSKAARTVLFESGEATSNLGKGMDDPHKAVWDFTNKEGMLVSRVTTHRQHVRGRESAAVVALDVL